MRHETEIRGWLALALELCDEADRLALGSFRRDVAVSEKPDRTLVSEADQAIELRIRERIRARHPDHGLVGEEYGSDGAQRSVRWYIDPIDGTHNFVRGVPVFATLLACERDGELRLGVLSAPALGDRWYAVRGGGAWAVRTADPGRGGLRRLATSRVGRLEDAHLLYGSVGDLERSGRVPGLRPLLGRAWRERGFGDFWGYALVAEGAAEAMVEVGLNSWDLAAPSVLVEEAGGRLTDFAGERSFARGEALASNGPLHDVLLDALSATPE